MYKPSQRQVDVEMLASAGWVSGTLHVPERSSLLAFLNKKAEFMPMTGLPGGEAGDFLAMRRRAVIVLVPDARDVEEHAAVQPGTYEPCRVRCLLEGVSVEGTIQVLSGQRMSDFLETNPGFFLVSDCHLVADDGHEQKEVAHVVVNAHHLLAVADLTRRVHAPVISLLDAVGAGR